MQCVPEGDDAVASPMTDTVIHQQTPGCSDVDVTLGGESAPSFRLLLPEHVHARDAAMPGGLHTIPGQWERHFGLVGGRFAVERQLEIAVLLMPASSGVRISLTFMNTDADPIEDLRAEVCASVNHLPGEPDWANERYLPGVECDRDSQGRYWYEKVTPEGLFAFDDHNTWTPMHRSPERPSAEGVDPYDIVVREDAPARGCAVRRTDGDEEIWLYQAWNTDSHWCCPFPGNACMHLRPAIAERLAPGESATIHGLAGVHSGSREELLRHVVESLI